MSRLSDKKLPFERLTIDASLAEKIFSDNPHKAAQVPSIAGGSASGHSVTVYRLGDHVDISAGPMVGDTSFLGRRCTIPTAHKIQQGETRVYRFQGVALPKEVYLNHFAFGILEKRASRLNMAGLQATKPTKPV